MRKPPPDLANEETEALLRKLEKRLTKEYSEAAKDVEDKFKDYMRRFEIKDKIKREAVDAGVLKETDYKAWRKSQILIGERWQAMLNDLSQDLHNANEIAISTARGYQEEAYALNHNYATYMIERDSGIDTSFTLFDRQTVERLVREDPKLLPDPRKGSKTARKIAENKDLRWNRQKLSSAIMQGVIQGETVPQMAKRLESVADMDHRAAIRNARTMVTGAQNAGRIDAAKRAQDMGIGLTNVWMATLDMRTRHEHRLLDGQRREVDEPFEVEGQKIRYPGDPEAAPQLVYNCRCTLIPQVKGFEYDIRGGDRVDYSALEKEGLDYEAWKASRVEKPNPITLPEEKAAAIKGSYINEYKQLRKKTLDNSGNGGIINNGYHGIGNAGSHKTIKKDVEWRPPRYPVIDDNGFSDVKLMPTVPTIQETMMMCNPTNDKKNCVKCVAAFEARMRRLPFQADKSYPYDSEIATVYDIFDNFHFMSANKSNPRQDIIDFLKKEKAGARVEIGASIDGDLHLFIGANDDGNIVFIDPQKKCSAFSYFDDFEMEDVKFARIDKLKFTDGINYVVVDEGHYG